jgi:hypothetical protein
MLCAPMLGGCGSATGLARAEPAEAADSGDSSSTDDASTAPLSETGDVEAADALVAADAVDAGDVVSIPVSGCAASTPVISTCSGMARSEPALNDLFFACTDLRYQFCTLGQVQFDENGCVTRVDFDIPWLGDTGGFEACVRATLPLHRWPCEANATVTVSTPCVISEGAPHR